MLVELHIIQNFAPSNLNRDDTNSPKDCTFGGYRRARISSQCFKRAIRTHPRFSDAVGGGSGVRTKRLASRVAELLSERGRDREEADQVVAQVLQGADYKVDEAGRTSVLLFVSPGELSQYARLIDESWDELVAAMAEEAEKKKPGTIKLSKELKKAIKDLGSSMDAADIALFGRMVAESTNLNIDAACQVAHAISTHPVDVEMDFYTAVDDLNPKEDTGAGMMGIIEFNSACFYRYAALHLDSLVDNLHGDKESALDAAVGFVQAAVAAIPSGKQNSMAAHNPPSYVHVRVREDGTPWSLANAFIEPARVGRKDGAGDLARNSIRKLESFDASLQEMYGDDGLVLDFRASTYPDHRDGNLSELVEALRTALA